MLISIIATLLLSFSAEAKFTAVCEASIFNVPNPQDESVELPLNFDQNFRAQASMEFKILPGHSVELTVVEKLTSKKVEWLPTTVLRSNSNGQVVSQGKRALLRVLKGEKGSWTVTCSSFDKTESMALPPPPADRREELRRKYLRGLGPVREYVSNKVGAFNGDAYDLYLQLLAQQTDHGQYFRQVIEGLTSKGFSPRVSMGVGPASVAWGKLVEAGTVCVDSAGRDFTCDIESVELSMDFHGSLIRENGERDRNEIVIKVIVQIYRDSYSRLIVGYRIKSVQLEENTGRGGTASTSGGR